MWTKSGDSNQGHDSIEHVIVSLLDSGLSIFHHSFVDEEVDPDLFSALITATSVQQKLQSDSNDRILQEQFQIERYTASVCHGEYLAGIIVGSGSVNNEVMNRFLKFLASFEEEYKFILKKAWNGDRSFFDHKWALNQLKENLARPAEGLQLHQNAMQKAENARQIRLVLLLKRYTHGNAVPKNELIQLIGDDLQIHAKQAEDYVNDLVSVGILSERFQKR